MAASLPRIVIIGSGGRLGGALARHLRLRDWPVIAFDRRGLDLTRPEMIRDRLEPLDYQGVIIAGALTQVDTAEAHPEEALAANAEGPALIAALSARKGAHVIYVSTDYVYDGQAPGLKAEDARLDPINHYGRSKIEGETRVLAATEGQALIARTSWIFGPDRPSFPDSVIQRAMTSSSVTGIQDKFSNPTYSEDFAHWLEPFLRGDVWYAGPVNFSNAGATSWQTYGAHALQCAAQQGVALQTTLVEGVPLASMNAFVAQRPIHTAMATDRLASLIGQAPRPWEEALEAYVARFYGSSRPT